MLIIKLKYFYQHFHKLCLRIVHIYKGEIPKDFTRFIEFTIKLNLNKKLKIGFLEKYKT